MSRFSGLVPGFHDEEHRRAFEAGRDAFLSRGGPPRCASLAKHGGSCGGWALHGCKFCLHHAPNDVQKARRLRLLAKPKTIAQTASVMRRERARIQRVKWRRNRWAAGSTVTLGARDEQFLADVRFMGFASALLSPATLDAARWAWLHVQTRRMTEDQFRVRLQWHTARDGEADGFGAGYATNYAALYT